MELTVCIIIAGYVIGLGAVTVIDIHGFLGRRSSYWTEATIRTHKVTKPLIWIGTVLILSGTLWFYKDSLDSSIPFIHWGIMAILVGNGLFLTFTVSNFLLKQEREGRGKELLPMSLQKRIIVHSIVSFLGWWGSLVLFIFFLYKNLAF